MIVELAKLEMEEQKAASKSQGKNGNNKNYLNKDGSRKESAYLFAHKLAKEKAEAAQNLVEQIYID